MFDVNATSHRRLVFILVVVGFFFLMFGNGIVSLTHPDEVFYAQTAKEMVAHKSWMTPYIFDKPQFEKPILFYWLLVPAVKWFGTSPFAVRFWPAFFGILGVMVTYWISWMLFASKRTSFLAGLILCTSVIYIALSRAVMTDMVFSIWVTLSMGCFYYGYRDKERKDTGIILCFVFSGLAVLTKGLLGFCFPAGMILGYLCFKKDIRFFLCRASLWGMAAFAVIAAPWHVLMVKLYGQEFLGEYFQNVHVRRLAEAEHPKCDTWYFYLGIIFGGAMPWTFFLFPALGLLFKRIKEKHAHRAPLLFLVSWVLGIYVFVQPAHSKLASYIFPAFPAIAMIIAYYIGNILANPEKSSVKILQGTAYVSSGLMAVIAVLSVVFARKYIDFVVDMVPVYVFAALVLLCAATVFIFTRRREFMKMTCAVPGIIIALFVLLALGKSHAEPWVSCKQISDVLKKTDQSDSVVLASKFYVRGVRFFTDRKMAVVDIIGKKFFSPHTIPFFVNDDQVLKFLKKQKQPVTFGIVKKATFHDLERAMRISRYTMTLLKEIGGKYLVRIE